MSISRVIRPRVEALLRQFPAVALLGPRQVGKTTLSRRIADGYGDQALYLDLELPSDRAKLTDPELYFDAYEDKLVVLDEIHRTPDIFAALRGIIDKRRHANRKANQFLLLGPASIDLLKQSSETLAGRISYVELTPFLATEAAQAGPLNQLWLRGGFPDSFLADGDSASAEWRSAFLRTYLERDLPALGPRIPAETMRRFWQMISHRQGQLLNAASLATSLGVSGQTVARYVDTLVDLLMVRRLPPWAVNAGKRLVRTPKIYVRDSGLVHSLLQIQDLDGLLGHPVAGFSWEGMIIENILACAPPESQGWFYRTAAGAEIDLLLQLPGEELWAIEVKRSISNPNPSRGFHGACEELNVTRRIVIYPGEEEFRIDAKTEVMPLRTILRAF